MWSTLDVIVEVSSFAVVSLTRCKIMLETVKPGV